ncbi:hypothetical protein CFC21_017487, partial [Triticum aestivum]
IGADIFKHALSYPSTLIANNAGMSGKFVIEKVLANDNASYGYNAANGCYEDLMASGILDPSKVVRCCIEHSAVVAKSFLTSDVVIVEAQESKPIRVRPPMPPRNLIPPMPASGKLYLHLHHHIERCIFSSISFFSIWCLPWSDAFSFRYSSVAFTLLFGATTNVRGMNNFVGKSVKI